MKIESTISQNKKTINEILTILKRYRFSEEKYHKLINLTINEIEKKSIGSMMSMAIWNAIRSIYKGQFEHLERGQWTDGTSMGLFIAEF